MATILIVDDRAVNRQFLLTLLGYGGHRLVEAADGQEGLERARAERPDLVITDILMPRMDGVAMAERLREDPATASIPIVFYTATYRMREARRMAESCGVAAVISKPSDPETILRVVAAALAGRPAAELTSLAAAPVAADLARLAGAGRLSSFTGRLQDYVEDLGRLHGQMTKVLAHGGEVVVEGQAASGLSQQLLDSSRHLQHVTLRLAGLLELSLELANQRDPVLLLGVFCRAAVEIVGARHAALGMLSDDGRELCFLVGEGIPAAVLEPLRSAPPAGLFRELVTGLQPLRLWHEPADAGALGLPEGHPPVRSLLALPIASSEGPLGWFYLAEKRGGTEFTAEDEQLTSTLAAQVAVSYENAALAEELETHAAQLRLEMAERARAEKALAERAGLTALAADVGKALISGDDLRAILQRLTELMVQHLDAAFARIWTVDEAGTSLLLQASAGLYTRLDGSHSRVRVGELKIGRIAATLEPHLTNDVLDDPLVDRAWARREGVVAFAGYPLVVEGRLTGVMAVFARRPLTGVALEALGAVADEIALGIEQRRTQEAVRRREERYRSLVLASAQIVWTSGPAGEVVEPSPSWQSYTGQAWEEYRGLGWLQTLHPEDRQRTLEAWNAALTAQSPYETECRVLAATGKYGTFVARGVPILAEDGKVREWVGTLTELTRQRSLEEQLRQAQKLEAVGRLAGGIAHDFNNLLTVIDGYTQLAADELPEDGQARQNLDEVRAAAGRAAALTRQLLAFSRRQVLAPRVLDLEELVLGMQRMVQRLIGNNVRLSVACAPETGRIKADPGQIEQVLMNLVVNARDALPEGGEITIQVGAAVLDDGPESQQACLPAGSYVLLEVHDNGFGMDAATQERIFEPFFTTKEEGKGTGLGLSTVYGIVRQSGGGIAVTSEPGRGTSFRIYLPRSDAERETQPPPRPRTPPPARAAARCPS